MERGAVAGLHNAEPYRVSLTDIFEGPMDLLVHLIRKNEISITDIPIAMVTEQYLQYLEWLEAMNVEYAAEFVVMASSLAQIKSRMLLPLHAEEGDEEDDPRQEIVRPLLEYLKLKSAAAQLSERPLLGEDTFTRGVKPGDLVPPGDEEVIKIGLFELIDAFQKILAGLPDEARIEFTTDTISVQERISQIADQLEIKGSLTFFELFADQPRRSEIIVTFLATLEMVKLSLIRIVQHVNSGIIRIFYM
ncbi:MAG: segregation/condensation protein A [Deltaproteobacteria bacterium]|nr:segregation/condensation protein A [Deltaproteobacteria bacterium]